MKTFSVFFAILALVVAGGSARFVQASDAPTTPAYPEVPVEVTTTSGYTVPAVEVTTTTTTTEEPASDAPTTISYPEVPVEVTTTTGYVVSPVEVTTTSEAPASDAPTTTSYPEVPVEVTTTAGYVVPPVEVTTTTTTTEAPASEAPTTPAYPEVPVEVTPTSGYVVPPVEVTTTTTTTEAPASDAPTTTNYPEVPVEVTTTAGYVVPPVEVTTTTEAPASDAPTTTAYPEVPVEVTTTAGYVIPPVEVTTTTTTTEEPASDAPTTPAYPEVPVEVTTIAGYVVPPVEVTTTTEAPASDALPTTVYPEVPVEVTTTAAAYRSEVTVEATGEGSGSGSEDENVCANRPDGSYSFGGCDNYYFICTANAVRFRNCPTPLVFDAVNQKCSWKHLVEVCREEATTAAPAADSSASELVYTPSCDGQADGIYPIAACSNQFLTCSGGAARVMDCPDELIFNPSIHVCDRPSAVAECTAGRASDPSESKCSQDGYFSFGECSSQFTACTNGRALVMFCPAGLKFSEANQICDYTHNVAECPATEEAAQDQSGDVPYSSSSYSDPAASGDGPTQCSNMDNGLHALGCTARVLSCQNGHEDIFECPSNLVFNEQSLICDFPQTSDKCDPEDNIIIRDVPVAPANECTLAGIYSDAVCSNTYHQCHDGQIVSFTCSEPNAVFSVADAECVDASLLHQCKKSTPLY